MIVGPLYLVLEQLLSSLLQFGGNKAGSFLFSDLSEVWGLPLDERGIFMLTLVLVPVVCLGVIFLLGIGIGRFIAFGHGGFSRPPEGAHVVLPEGDGPKRGSAKSKSSGG